MADYYPLIARAVAGLEKNTGDARRALYERARTALVAQLRSVTPALSENDVTRERLALEESIRKVEAEAARKAWVDPSQTASTARVRAPAFPRWEPPAPVAEVAPEDEPSPRHQPARTDGALLRQTTMRTGRPLAPAGAPAAATAATAATTAATATATATAAPPAMLREQRYAEAEFDQPPPAENEPRQLRNGQSAAASARRRTPFAARYRREGFPRGRRRARGADRSAGAHRARRPHAAAGGA